MKKILPVALSILLMSSVSVCSFAEDNTSSNNIELKNDVDKEAKETVVEAKRLVTVDYKLNVSRVSGKDRYLTSVEISKAYFKNSDIVVVASGKEYIDALVGGSLVSQIKSPLLLVNKDKISKEVINEIKRLKAKDVIILGGNNTVSLSVENQISKLGVRVERLAGENRYATAQKIAYARYYFNSKDSSNPMGEQFVGIDGKNYPDALIAGAIVGQIKGDTLSYIIPNSSKLLVNRPYWLVFGGINSVPQGPAETKRISGNDRYETSVNGARMFKELTGNELKTIILADGRNYPDALAASSIAGVEGATVVLTKNNTIPDVVLNYIKEGSIDKVIIAGGEQSINTSVENQIKNIVIKKEIAEKN